MPTMLECFDKQGKKVAEADISKMSKQELDIICELQKMQGRTYRVVKPYKVVGNVRFVRWGEFDDGK